MKWTYSIQQKTTAAILLAVIFAVIFVVNRIGNNKVAELGDSMNSVYEDRLMVENYIFRLSGLLYEKKIMLDQCSGVGESAENLDYLKDQNAEIAVLIHDYDQTKLTEVEAILFNNLKKQVTHIQLQEELLLGQNSAENEAALLVLKQSFSNANQLLHDLSNVQITVGKTVNERSQQLVAGSSLLTQFELAVLIVIATLINALIFTSRSVWKKAAGNVNLN